MNVNDCCSPCATVPPVNIPGAPGNDGAPGATGSAGVSSYTLTTGGLTIAAGPNTINVSDASWVVIGQVVIVSDGTNFANFRVTGKTGTSITGTYLGYNGDAAVGVTIISPAGVSPSGTQAPLPSTLLPVLSAYGVAGAQALTNAFAQALNLSVTLGVTGTHLLFCAARFDYVGTTFAANQIVSLKIYRTNNTPGDIANAIGNLQTAVITTLSYTAGEIVFVPVSYSGTAGDILIPQVQVDATPGAGSVNVVECGIVALPLF